MSKPKGSDEMKHAPPKVDAYLAPQQQQMGIRTGLESASGVVIRQVSQPGEVILQLICPCCPFEKQNKYKIAQTPAGTKAIQFVGDKDGYRPTLAELDQMPASLLAQEESSIVLRFLLGCMGMKNLRPLDMNFTLPDNSVGIQMERAFTLGGFCCCPHNSTIRMGNAVIGRVEEDIHCGKNYCSRYCGALCCAKWYLDMQVPTSAGTFEPKYQLLVNTSCCGPHFNYCGATPCCNDMLFDIYSYNGGVVDYSHPVGHMQKTYAGGGCSLAALCRFCYAYDNYILEFPPNASVQDKALFLGGFLETEYLLFEKS